MKATSTSQELDSQIEAFAESKGLEAGELAMVANYYSDGRMYGANVGVFTIKRDAKKPTFYLDAGSSLGFPIRVNKRILPNISPIERGKVYKIERLSITSRVVPGNQIAHLLEKDIDFAYYAPLFK